MIRKIVTCILFSYLKGKNRKTQSIYTCILKKHLYSLCLEKKILYYYLCSNKTNFYVFRRNDQVKI